MVGTCGERILVLNLLCKWEGKHPSLTCQSRKRNLHYLSYNKWWLFFIQCFTMKNTSNIQGNWRKLFCTGNLILPLLYYICHIYVHMYICTYMYIHHSVHLTSLSLPIHLIFEAFPVSLPTSVYFKLSFLKLAEYKTKFYYKLYKAFS